MAWQNVPNSTVWQFDNNPPDPGGAESTLWAKQTGGIRTHGSHQVYTRVRRVGDPDMSRGELSKTYWDNQ
jgi:hypothetical protein